jgi:hypothetical protein
MAVEVGMVRRTDLLDRARAAQRPPEVGLTVRVPLALRRRVAQSAGWGRWRSIRTFVEEAIVEKLRAEGTPG